MADGLTGVGDTAIADDPFAALWRRNGQGHVTACPCLALNIYLDETDRGHVLAFYERALEVVRPHLTHYLAERMKWPAELGPKAWTMVPGWLHKPSFGREYAMRMWSGDPKGVGPWSLEVLYTDIPPDAARRARYPAFLADWESKVKHGAPEIPGTTLRVTVPVDAVLAQPQAWTAWVMGFEIIAQGWFMSAESGFSLTTRGDIDDQGFMLDACEIHPGLDWFSPRHVRYMRRYDAVHEAILFKIKRASWLTFLHEHAVTVMGGADALGTAMGAHRGITVHPVRHGLGIQAGLRPHLGDLRIGDWPDLQGHVARALKLVQLDHVHLAFRDAFMQRWFNMFDDPIAHTPSGQET